MRSMRQLWHKPKHSSAFLLLYVGHLSTSTCSNVLQSLFVSTVIKNMVLSQCFGHFHSAFKCAEFRFRFTFTFRLQAAASNVFHISQQPKAPNEMDTKQMELWQCSAAASLTCTDTMSAFWWLSMHYSVPPANFLNYQHSRSPPQTELEQATSLVLLTMHELFHITPIRWLPVLMDQTQAVMNIYTAAKQFYTMIWGLAPTLTVTRCCCGVKYFESWATWRPTTGLMTSSQTPFIQNKVQLFSHCSFAWFCKSVSYHL